MRISRPKCLRAKNVESLTKNVQNWAKTVQKRTPSTAMIRLKTVMDNRPSLIPSRAATATPTKNTGSKHVRVCNRNGQQTYTVFFKFVDILFRLQQRSIASVSLIAVNTAKDVSIGPGAKLVAGDNRQKVA